MDRQNIVICGAGIAGISTAYHLAVKHGVKDIVLVDERPPLSLTSDKSTECYRNWWPGPGRAMVSLMNRSIDLLEDLAVKNSNSFHLNRRGYLYLTADEDNIPVMLAKANESSRLGAGQLRIHKGDLNDPGYQIAKIYGFSGNPDGADLILDRDLIRKYYPDITQEAVAALHIRRAGWLSAQQLGSLLLEKTKSRGAQLIEGRVQDVDILNNRVSSVILESGERIHTHHFVNAAGPFVKELSGTFGVDLPVFCELHLKVSATDHLGIIPRDAPMLIWQDPQKLPWTSDERELIIEDPDSRWMLGKFPPGVHTRPEGLKESQIVLMLWEYQTMEVDPVWPPPLEDDYPEIALRGLATMIPGFKRYFDRPPRPFLDGGYYTKTRENRPLIGPLPVEGTWIIGALSGFGIMASMAAGELLANHILGDPLPDYAPSFDLRRYQDPEYIKLLDEWSDFGQL
jgi:glycine/D-amino acid oxidase-like deaminating enzyme